VCRLVRCFFWLVALVSSWSVTFVITHLGYVRTLCRVDGNVSRTTFHVLPYHISQIAFGARTHYASGRKTLWVFAHTISESILRRSSFHVISLLIARTALVYIMIPVPTLAINTPHGLSRVECAHCISTFCTWDPIGAQLLHK